MKKVIIVLFVMVSKCAIAQINESYKVASYYNNSSIQNGAIALYTQIPFDKESMPQIHIEGYEYDMGTPISLDIAFYLNSSAATFDNASVSSSGGFIPNVYLAEKYGNVAIYLETSATNMRFVVTAYGEGLDEEPSWFQDWEIADEPVDGYNVTQILYGNRFKDYVGVEGVLEATDINAQVITSSNISGNYISSNGFMGGYLTITNGMTNSNGNYFSHGDNHISQNSYLASSVWKSIGLKSTYGSAVVLETLGKTGKAFNILVDTSISSANENLSFTNLFSINTNGKTGIGTADPKELLQVNGNITTSKGYRFNSYSNGGNKYLSSGYGSAFILDTLGNLIYSNTSTSGSADASATMNEVFVIDKDGKVGIGTSVPQAKLAVNGHIYATKVKVTQTGWPDYVFEPGYKLPTLEEVERFIQANKHLPDVPSAKEIEKNGDDIGDTQAILLKKIEELTLYMIEQNKQMDILKKEVADLRKQQTVATGTN